MSVARATREEHHRGHVEGRMDTVEALIHDTEANWNAAAVDDGEREACERSSCQRDPIAQTGLTGRRSPGRGASRHRSAPS
jgi:hypothetical protein